MSPCGMTWCRNSNREPAASVAPVSPALAATSRFASVSNSSTTTAGAEADGASNRFLLERDSSSRGGDGTGDFTRFCGLGEWAERLMEMEGLEAHAGPLSTCIASGDISESLFPESWLSSRKENRSLEVMV